MNADDIRLEDDRCLAEAAERMERMCRDEGDEEKARAWAQQRSEYERRIAERLEELKGGSHED